MTDEKGYPIPSWYGLLKYEELYAYAALVLVMSAAQDLDRARELLRSYETA